MEEREIHLRDYLRIVYKRKSTIFTFFIITLLIVIIKTFTEIPMYMAATRVLIEKNTSRDFTDAYSYQAYDPEFLETQYQLIKSASVAEKVIKNLDVDKVYPVFFENRKDEDEKPSMIKSVKTWIKDQIVWVKDLAGLGKTPTEESDEQTLLLPEADVPLTKEQQMAAVIKGGILAVPISNSRVVEISFWSHNPVIAMQVVNSVADAYINELLDMQMEVTGYSINWMQDKAEEQRIKLEESEEELLEYKRKHDIVTIENRLTVLPERLSELSSKLTMAETRRKELSAVYQQVRNVSVKNLETIPAIVKNSSVEGVDQKILQVEQKISELSKKFGARHPNMITANNELKSLNEKKSEELQKAVQTIKNEYELALANERDLRALLDQTKFQASNLGERSIQLNILQRKVDTNRYLYDALVKQIKEKGITEKSQAVNVWVIEKASLPQFPAKPQKKRNILLGIVLGLFGGIGLAFFFEYLDNTIKTPEDVEEKFNLPVISTIDLFTGKKNTTLVKDVVLNPSSMNAENFRGLRTSLLLSSADKAPKIIMTTSMAPGEGKSSISACLGISVAQTDKKVLIIDGDMRRPMIHKIFNVPNVYGLSSLLAGIQKKEDQQIFFHPMKNLDVITAGPIPPNPSELLSAARIPTLFENFSKKYDMIIIDTPPVASVTDPVILSKNVDGVIIVTWSGKTTYDLFGKGLKQLRDVSAPITGVVLNRFNAKKSGYYYNYGDYYYSSDTS